jgi:hypothetical protein
MIRLGVVAAGPAVRIADGTQASAGDLILCTRNDHTVHATWAGPSRSGQGRAAARSCSRPSGLAALWAAVALA